MGAEPGRRVIAPQVLADLGIPGTPGRELQYLCVVPVVSPCVGVFNSTDFRQTSDKQTKEWRLGESLTTEAGIDWKPQIIIEDEQRRKIGTYLPDASPSSRCSRLGLLHDFVLLVHLLRPLVRGVSGALHLHKIVEGHVRQVPNEIRRCGRRIAEIIQQRKLVRASHNVSPAQQWTLQCWSRPTNRFKLASQRRPCRTISATYGHWRLLREIYQELRKKIS